MILGVDGITFRYNSHPVLEDITFQVHTHQITAILGPNGAGKTTTIRILTALISPTSGGATVLGWKIGQDDSQIRRRVGILTESPGLYDRLSAERNLAFFARLYEVEDIPGQVERYLRMLGLWDRREEAAGTFSKGMRQKLAIARALLHEPQALFLDEPTSALDPEAAHMVREFIAGLKHEGRTIFLCTHNLDEADRLCDRIAVFNTRLLALDTPTALRRQLYERTVVFHLRQVDPRYVERVESLPFVRTVRSMDDKLLVAVDEPEDNNPTIVRSLVEAGAEIQFVGELRRSLEDIYLKLIKEEEAGSGVGDQGSD